MSFPVIPGYEISEQLGQGAMGTVYKARQVALDRTVAIKVLRPELAQNARYLERIQREAKLAARLDHANVVRGIDYGIAEGRPYFVMEFAEGRGLHRELKERGRFGEAEAIRIAIQIAGALENAYRNGVVHRDVKPANIVLSSQGVAKLTDLGLARRPGDPSVTHSGATMGTPQYISPEQARNPSAVDVRSDIYSLGATLYHLVTGSPPFAGESLADLLTKVLFEQAEAASTRESSVSPGFSLVLRKMLAKDPARRYQTPGELIEDLHRVQAHEPPKVEEKSLVESASSPWRLPVAAISASVALGLAWWFFAPESSPERVKPPSVALDLDKLRPDPALSSRELLDRLDRIAIADRTAELREADRLALASFELETKRLLLLRVRAACAEESARLADLVQAKRYLEVAAFFEREHAEELVRKLEAPAERLARLAPEAAAEWDRWRGAEAAIFTQKRKRLGEGFALSSQRFVSKLESKILDRIGAMQLRQAWRDLEAAESFRDEEGHSAQNLPAETSAQGRAILDRFLQEARAKLEAASRERREFLIAEIQRAEQSLEAKLPTGSFVPVADLFDREIEKIQARWKGRPEDLLAQDENEYAKAYSFSRSQLETREESLRREAAARVLFDFDEEFAPFLRQRDYGRVLEEWSALTERPSMDPVREELDARLREMKALLRLRETFGKAIQDAQGKTVEIREGAIHKSGRVLRGFDARTGEFVLEPEQGPLLPSAFSRVHYETVGRLCGFLEANSEQIRGNLRNEDLYAWAVFHFYEGNFALARPLLDRLGRSGFLPFAVSSALKRLDRQERAIQEAQKERERVAREAVEAAQRLSLVGEYTRARDKYSQCLKDFGDLDWIRQRRAEIEAEMTRLQEEERARARAEALRSQFPGAAVLPLDDNRLVLRYGFRGATTGGWKVSEGWAAAEGGLRRKERCRDALDFKNGSGPQIGLPLSLASGARVSFRLAFPFEGGEPFYTSFSVAGHSFGVWSGGEAFVGQVASWVGGLESYEAHFHHPGWGGPAPANTPRFRFLRGGRYEVAVEILPGGKEARLRIDGQEIARSLAKSELPAPLREKIEFRCWETAELREVTVEGVSGEGIAK